MKIGFIGCGLMHIAMSARSFGLANDIYAEFGVANATMSTSQEEHEQNMLALDVDTRDGDDQISLSALEEEHEEEQEVPLEDQEVPSDDEGDEEQEDGDGSDEQSDDEHEDQEFKALGEPDAELKAATAQINEYAEGFESLKNQAIERGLDAAIAADIVAQVDAGEALTEAQLVALEAAGYTRQFVNSYIKGQEAITQSYADSIIKYAGGKEQFDAIMTHLKATDPSAEDALYGAIERQDLALIRTMINLGMAGRTKKFGTAPARNLARKAPASAPKAARTKAEGFASKTEMTKAMSDPRYGRDTAYTQNVEQKVWVSNW